MITHKSQFSYPQRRLFAVSGWEQHLKHIWTGTISTTVPVQVQASSFGRGSRHCQCSTAEGEVDAQATVHHLGSYSVSKEKIGSRGLEERDEPQPGRSDINRSIQATPAAGLNVEGADENPPSVCVSSRRGKAPACVSDGNMNSIAGNRAPKPRRAIASSLEHPLQDDARLRMRFGTTGNENHRHRRGITAPACLSIRLSPVLQQQIRRRKEMGMDGRGSRAGRLKICWKSPQPETTKTRPRVCTCGRSQTAADFL